MTADPTLSTAPALGSAALEAVETAAMASVVDAAPADLRSRTGLRLDRVGGFLAMAAPAYDVLAFNRVLAIDAVPPGGAWELDALLDHYRTLGARRLFLPWPPGSPDCLRERLAAAGFRLHNHWVKLSRDASPVEVGRSPFRRVTLGHEHRQAFTDVLEEAFGWPRPLAALFAGPIGAADWTHLGLYDGDDLVAVAGLYRHGDAAWLGPAATRATHRGRGAQQELVAHRVALARAAGCRILAVETADPAPDKPVPSYRNLRRLEFTVAYRRPNHLHDLLG